MINNYNDSYYQGNVDADKLFYGEIHDIWVRDFGSQQIQNTQYKFDYSPEYLDDWTSNLLDNSFLNWLNTQDIDYTDEPLVLDGGNLVTDGISKAVVTTRVFADNPTYSETEMRNYFQTNLGIEEIAFVPEEDGDITGHSDGMVFWLTPNKLAVCDYDEPFKTEVYNALTSEFTDVEFIDMPYAPTGETSPDGFPNYKGVYVNALRTTDNIYVPTYNLPEDEMAIAVFETHTNKTIIPVDSDEVSLWGGSVHCLSWEVLRAQPHNILGDVNFDGSVDILDVIITVNFVLGIEPPPTENELLAADVNEDGNLNVLDVILIVILILGE